MCFTTFFTKYTQYMNCFYGNTTMTISEFISRRETILTSGGNIKGIMQYLFTGPQASLQVPTFIQIVLI